VEAELADHGAGLAGLPRILCLSKADLVTPEEVDEAIGAWSTRMGDSVLSVLATSAATGTGLDELRAAVVRNVPVDQTVAPAESDVEAEHRVYRPGADRAFEVSRTGPGAFRVEGEGVARLFARHDVTNDESLRYIEDRLRRIGVIKALEAAGFEPGDDVEIAGVVYELDPGSPL
jgi:GTP-binding protein